MSEDKDRGGFSAEQKLALASVLDEIIPPSDDGRLPGAGELGLATYIEEALRSTPELASMIVQGLAALEGLARRRSPQGFAALSRHDQSEVINELASSEHAFPPILMLHTFAGYYQQPRVLEALGLETRPPHPQGYEMEPNDFSILDDVRGRPKSFR